MGRPWRDGQVDAALGVAGLAVTDDLRGLVDGYGNPLEVTVRAVADEVAALADLVKGKLDGHPAALVRGLAHLVTDDDGPGATALLRGPDADWFRWGHVEAVRASVGVPPGTDGVTRCHSRPGISPTGCVVRSRSRWRRPICPRRGSTWTSPKAPRRPPPSPCLRLLATRATPLTSGPSSPPAHWRSGSRPSRPPKA